MKCKIRMHIKIKVKFIKKHLLIKSTVAFNTLFCSTSVTHARYKLGPELSFNAERNTGSNMYVVSSSNKESDLTS